MAAFLDPLELWSFLKSHPAANLDPTMTIRIPVDELEETVLQMFPFLKKFEKISIENLSHLAIIKNLHHPQLRHLIVYLNELNPQNVLRSIGESLVNFAELISLKIDTTHHININLLVQFGLPNFTILPVMIPYSLSNEAVRLLLPSLQRFEKNRIGLNPSHLDILKECTNLRRLSVFQNAADTQIGETFPLIIGHLSSFNSLKSLQIYLHRNRRVLGMAPLEKLTELTELELYGFDSLDLSFVSGLKKLKKLSIVYARALRSIQPIAGLPQLEELDLSWNRGLGSDYASILPGMEKLKRLNLRGSVFEDVSFLGDMMTLDRLDIRDCGVIDISSLSGLPIYSDKQKLIWNDSTGPRRLDPRTM
jgi:hypothetical protein